MGRGREQGRSFPAQIFRNLAGETTAAPSGKAVLFFFVREPICMSSGWNDARRIKSARLPLTPGTTIPELVTGQTKHHHSRDDRISSHVHSRCRGASSFHCVIFVGWRMSGGRKLE